VPKQLGPALACSNAEAAVAAVRVGVSGLATCVCSSTVSGFERGAFSGKKRLREGDQRMPFGAGKGGADMACAGCP
jgi:hypothetical protein